jgi:hypothetical protein
VRQWHTGGVYILWTVLVVAALAGMLWLANRIEPHMVNKEGNRFLCSAVFIDRQSSGAYTMSSPREAWVTLLSEGGLQLMDKQRLKRRFGMYKLVGRGTEPPRGKATFVVSNADGDNVVLRLPAGSRMVPILDQIVAERTSR